MSKSEEKRLAVQSGVVDREYHEQRVASLDTVIMDLSTQLDAKDTEIHRLRGELMERDDKIAWLMRINETLKEGVRGG